MQSSCIPFLTMLTTTVIIMARNPFFEFLTLTIVIQPLRELVTDIPKSLSTDNGGKRTLVPNWHRNSGTNIFFGFLFFRVNGCMKCGIGLFVVFVFPVLQFS